MFYTSASVKQMKDRKGKPWRGTLQYKKDGEWKQKTKVFGKDIRLKRDAEVACNRWREKMEREAQEQLLGTKPAKTVCDAVRDFLDKQHDLNKLTTGTYQSQSRKVDLYIEPYFDGKDFYKVTRSDVSDFVRELSVKLKPNSVRGIYSIVAKTYKDAQRNGDIEVSPCAFISLPELDDHKINYLDEDGRRKFLTLLDNLDKRDWRYIAGTLGYYTGMRASEICALQWGDINFAAKTITVNKSARSIKDDRNKVTVEINKPKTRKAKRTIPLIAQAEQALLAYLDGKDPRPTDTVLDKSRINPANTCASFRSWTKANGILGSLGKPITMHGLRHTFATIGVQANVDIKSLASILGHARADMTLNVYASDDEKAKRMAMGSVEQYFQNEGANDF